MKKYSCLLLLFIGFPFFLFANKETDSLLLVLDGVIKEKGIYSEKKERVIDSLQTKLVNSGNDWEKYGIYRDLLREYRFYNVDLALKTAYKRLEIAKRLTQKQVNSATMNIAEIMSIAGMYKETLDILNHIDRTTLANKPNDNQFTYYYHLYHSIYTLMYRYTSMQKEKNEYRQLVYQYKDSLLLVNDPATVSYRIIKANQLLMDGKADDALLELADDMARMDKDNPMLAYTLADIYGTQGDTEQEKKYLAIAAISDIQSASKEYVSLRELAILLYRQGDVKRAYAYMKCSIEDAIACRATFRILEVSETLPLIVSAYELQMKKKQETLSVYLFIISTLLVMIVIMLVISYKQLQKTRKAQKVIRQINEELKNSNNNLQLSNEKLSESDRVKEEYIGYVFSLYSTYIDKLNTYRQQIYNRIRMRKFDDLVKMTNSHSLGADELQEFLHNFDTIFLELYPNFVQDFNALLVEDARIIPNEDEILTPELRIFALVRLGIKDSTKIAQFLRYSPQTIYNYRMKIRNKSTLPKDEFLQAIENIGKKA